MNSLHILKTLKERGYHLTIIEKDTGIAWHRLHRTMKAKQELSESEYRTLLDYLESKGIEDENCQ